MALIRIDPATVVRLVANRLDTLETASGGHVKGMVMGGKPEVTEADSSVTPPACAVLVGVGLAPDARAVHGEYEPASARVTVRLRVVCPAERVGLAAMTAWYSSAGHAGKLFERWSTIENAAASRQPDTLGHHLELFDAAYPSMVELLGEETDGGHDALQGDVVIEGRVTRDKWNGSGSPHGGAGQETVGGGA